MDKLLIYKFIRPIRDTAEFIIWKLFKIYTLKYSNLKTEYKSKF